MRIATVAILGCALCPGAARAACAVSPNPGLGLILPDELEASPAQQHPSEPASDPFQLTPQSSSNERAAPSIVGFWFVNFFSDGKLWDRGFDQWHSDGTEILNDAIPPSLGNVCLGVWKQTGPRTYKLRHPAFNFDASGNVIGTGVMVATIKLDDDGDTYRGRFVAYNCDLSRTLISEMPGTLTAHRIRVE
jgi:hypothetical protein